MLNIPQTASSDDIDQRNRDVLRVKGVKTLIQMYNITANHPIMLHVALVTWKNQANGLGS